MQTPIVNNHNKQNFTGFYRIRHTNKTFMDLLQNQVVPLYEITTHKPAYIFQGRSPFDSALEKTIRAQVENEGYSYKWFVQNAKNHGLNVPDFDDIDTWVITGAEDIKSLAPLFKQDKVPFLTKFINNIKNFFTVSNQNSNNIPEHLQMFTSIMNRNEKLVQDYRDLIADKKVVEVDNLENLIKEMVLGK